MPYNDNFTPVEKANFVIWYAESKNVRTVRSRFYQMNGRTRKPPSKQSIMRWFNLFKQTAELKKTTKRGKKPVNDETIAAIKNFFESNPKASVRAAAYKLQTSKSTVQKVIRKHLKKYPYKIQRLHALKECDYQRRLEYADFILEQDSVDTGYLNNICFSDESTFHVSGLVHRHNCRIWGTEKPSEFRQVERASPKINVWCGLFIDRVIGPFFFDGKTVTQNNFLKMLNEKIIPEIKERPPRLGTVRFQLDGAPPHWGLSVRDCLNQEFPEKWIGRGGPIPWPARSPDLTPLDFFLWGYVKTKVFTTEVRGIDHLKQRIEQAVATITPAMLVNTWGEMRKRLLKLKENGGRHVET